MMGSFYRIGALKSLMLAGIALLVATVGLSTAQTTKPGAAPAPAPSLTALSGKWEDIDQRFVFLTVELSSTEASLNAVNRAILVTGHQQSSKQQQSQAYQKGSEQMDRNGGGPIPWQDFYGKTAESFYYHPSASLSVQSKSSSLTIVGQSQKQTTIQANSQGDQTQVERPPQFDYIYQANADAQKRADTEVAKLGGQVDQLQARRKQLEGEQSTLWCKIAWRALETRELSDKPIYRFEAKSAGGGEEQAQQLAAIEAGAKFMRKINALVAQTQTAIDGDQAAVYSKLAEVVKQSRSELKTNLLMQDSLQMALDDDKSAIGQFAKAAKRLEDSAQNLSDAYGLAQDGDNAGDIQRKLSFRGAIQQMTMDFAATVLTADQTLQAAAAEWKIKPDVKKPIAEETTMWIVPTTRPVVQIPIIQSSAAQPTVIAANQESSKQEGSRSAANPDSSKGAPGQLINSMTGQYFSLKDTIYEMHGGDRISTKAKYSPPVAFRLVAMTDSTNLRMAYSANQIIFNWEKDKTNLQINGGPADGRHAPGMGEIPVNQWVTIDLVVLPNSISISVDGKRRYLTNADFSQTNEVFSIFPDSGSIVRVKSSIVSRPR